MLAPRRRADSGVLPLAGALAAAAALQLLLGLARSVLLARWLGAEELGRLGFALALLGFADAAALWAGPTLLVREVAATPRRDGVLFGTALLIRAVAALAAGLVVTPWIGWWAVPWLLAQVGQLGTALLRARRLTGGQVLAGLLPPLLLLGAVAAAATGAAVPSATTALAALALAGAAAAAAQLALAAVRLANPPAWTGAAARTLLRESAPLWAGGLVAALLYRQDVLLLKALLPAADAARAIGYYQPAYSLVESGHLLLGALVTAAFPVLAALHGRDPAGMRAAFGRAFRAALALGAAAAVGTALLAGPVVALLYREEFAPAAPALALLAPALLFVLLNSLQANLLVAARRQDVPVKIALGMAAFNALLNLGAIPRWGYLGAAAVTAATEGLGLVAMLAATRSLRRGGVQLRS